MAATPQKQIEITEEGIFCDCYGTLFSHSFKKDDLLVDYLNAKHAAGISITLISTNPMQVRSDIKDIGLHPAIVSSLTNKAAFRGSVLEELIDDEPSILARKVWKPEDKTFRQHMTNFIASHAAVPAEPTSAI